MGFRIKQTEQCHENYIPPQKHMQRFWLGTKKHPYSIDNLELPGLIDYNQDALPIVGFTIGLTFEIVGLYLLFAAGLNWYSAVALGLVDILFAILRHFPVKKLSLLKNQVILLPPGPPLQLAKRKVKNLKLLGWFLSLPILAICGVKIIGFIGFVGGIDPKVLLVIVSYVIVAVIHLTLTGYFFWWMFAEISDYFAHNSYKKALDVWGIENPGVFPPFPPPLIGAPNEITSPSTSNPIEIPGLEVPGYVVNRHILINNQLLDAKGGLPKVLFRDVGLEETRPALECTAKLNEFLAKKKIDKTYSANTYILFSWGVLTDQHIKEFCNFIPVPPAAVGTRAELAKELVRCQFNIMGLPDLKISSFHRSKNSVQVDIAEQNDGSDKEKTHV